MAVPAPFSNGAGTFVSDHRRKIASCVARLACSGEGSTCTSAGPDPGRSERASFDNFPPGLPGRMATLASHLPGGITLAARQLRIGWLRTRRRGRTALVRHTEALSAFAGHALVLWSPHNCVMPPAHGHRLAELIPTRGTRRSRTPTCCRCWTVRPGSPPRSGRFSSTGGIGRSPSSHGDHSLEVQARLGAAVDEDVGTREVPGRLARRESQHRGGLLGRAEAFDGGELE